MTGEQATSFHKEPKIVQLMNNPFAEAERLNTLLLLGQPVDYTLLDNLRHEQEVILAEFPDATRVSEAVLERNIELVRWSSDHPQAERLRRELETLASVQAIRGMEITDRPFKGGRIKFGEPEEEEIVNEIPKTPSWVHQAAVKIAKEKGAGNNPELVLRLVWDAVGKLLIEHKGERRHFYEETGLPRVYQVTVRDRLTCVLANLQMLMQYSGVVTPDFLKDDPDYLVKLKSRMMDEADALRFLSPSKFGTINLNMDLSSQNNWLSKISDHARQSGYQDSLHGEVQCLRPFSKAVGSGERDGILTEIIRGMLNDQCCYSVTCGVHQMFIEGIEVGDARGEEPVFILWDTLGKQQSKWPISTLLKNLQTLTLTIYRATQKKEIVLG